MTNDIKMNSKNLLDAIRAYAKIKDIDDDELAHALLVVSLSACQTQFGDAKTVNMLLHAVNRISEPVDSEQLH